MQEAAALKFDEELAESYVGSPVVISGYKVAHGGKRGQAPLTLNGISAIAYSSTVI